MLKNSKWMRAACAATVAAGVLVWMAAVAWRRAPVTLRVSASPVVIPADGVSRATITVRDTAGKRLRAGDVTVRVVSGNNSARVVSIREDADALAAFVEAGIVPGSVEVEAQGPGIMPARAELTTRLEVSDRAGDGTPDFLRLESPADRDAFRRWFAFLAESQALTPTKALPREIVDCAALARFAYREALRKHDAAWAQPLHLGVLPAIPGVEKYSYPYTPLGAALFRVRPGAFAASDLTDGTFAEFANAKTLATLNAHFVTRDLSRALPGDLLFYLPEGRQDSSEEPHHTMIYLGSSQLEPGPEKWIVYHTGPINLADDSPQGGPAGPPLRATRGTGEIRRVTLAGLQRHPDPRWRPVETNPYFLGVYRWNILRGAE